jgi:NADP-dependent 3-hydroxy acid dehydrogenase YdfG/acyl carrier protein
LQVKGATLLSGYYRNPQLSQESFNGDGWFITGDTGFLDSGRLTITGREKDIIIINGINFYSHEIESAVEEIEEVEGSFTAACAVRETGSDTDQLAIFFSPAHTDGHLPIALISEIRKRVAKSIGAAAQYVIPVEKNEIPKTSIGKIQRSQLAQRFQAGEFGDLLKRIDIESDNANTLPDWFYKRIWRRKDGRNAPLNPRPGGAVLLFLDSLGLGARLCASLRESNRTCITVEAGSEFSVNAPDSYQLDVGNPYHYQRLMYCLADRQLRIEQLVHLWTYEEYKGEVSSLEELDKAQDASLYSILFLVQALAESQEAEFPVRLSVVSSFSRGLVAEDPIAYEKSPMLGLLKTIPQEMPWLSCHHIDLPLGKVEVNAARVLLEMDQGRADAEVAYRDGERLVSRLRRVDLRQRRRQDLPFKHGGFYLLSGGLGGIGVEVSRYLLKNYGAKLLLIGRTPLVETAMDPGVAEQSTEASLRLQTFQELKQLGGEVMYEAGDVCDPSALERALENAQSRWDCELDGVIQLAGTFEAQTVLGETRENMARILKAKMSGTWALHQLIKQRSAETVFISFSSVNGYFGGMAVGAYAAANSFLDSFVHYQRHAGLQHSYSYSWSLWDEVGMSRSYKLKDLSKARGYYAITPTQGMNSWLAGLHHGERQLLVGLDGGNRHIRQSAAGETCALQKATIYFTAKAEATAGGPDSQWRMRDKFGRLVDCEYVQVPEMPLNENGKVDREQLLGLNGKGNGRPSNGEEVPRTDVERRLVRIWEDLLGVTSVGINDNFFELGGHSLLSTQLISRLRDSFKLQIPVRSLFESPTIVGLAERIETTLWAMQDHEAGLRVTAGQREEGEL